MPLSAVSPKETLRETIKQRLSAISAEEFRLQGAKAAALLCPSPLWARYETLLLFLSTSSEIAVQALLEAALKDGKKVFVPKVEAKRLVFRRIRSPDGPWRIGPFGIREAAGEEALDVPADFPALILAPGLAFDRQGNRLGRGGGYYDRFFAELDEGRREYAALGLCMDFQVLKRVPTDVQDKKLDGLLSGSELTVF